MGLFCDEDSLFIKKTAALMSESGAAAGGTPLNVAVADHR